jgi:diaminopimelate decarboxylase
MSRVAVILMLEPGRSLVADACVVVSRVLGVKSNGGEDTLSLHSSDMLFDVAIAFLIRVVVVY